MNSSTRIFSFVGFILIGIAVTTLILYRESPKNKQPERLNGVNLVAPRSPFQIDSLRTIQQIGAKWVAIVPYAFCNAQTAEITFDHPRQWWGEKPEGVIESIKMAHSLGLKVMLKPHLWVGGQGWAGDLSFPTDSLWQVFEQHYEAYLNAYIKIADSLQVDLVCIGTEVRQSTDQRKEFWQKLISQSKSQYSGKLTYAANWDEYEQIEFWDQMDYIGIDAYFPLSEEKVSKMDELMSAWELPKMELKRLSEQLQKPILFTEYGYESIDYNTIGHWKVSKDSLAVNFENQAIAFAALYQTFKSEDWWAGGFIWKWHLDRNGLGNRTIKAYTPQDKPALNVIKDHFVQPN